MKFLSLHERWRQVFPAAYLSESTWFDKIESQLSKNAGMSNECSAWTVPTPAAQNPAALAGMAGNSVFVLKTFRTFMCRTPSCNLD